MVCLWGSKFFIIVFVGERFNDYVKDIDEGFVY